MKTLKIMILLAAIAGAQQVYDNPALNAHYEVPAGWVMEKPDVNYFGVHILTTRVGLRPVHLYLEKYSTQLEALMERGSFAFVIMATFYKNSSTSTAAPIVPYLDDTTYTSGIGISGMNIRHVALDRHTVCYAASFKNYVQKLCYETNMKDFEDNYLLYGKNWTNLGFINTNTAAAKAMATRSNQASERESFVNALGRQGANGLKEPGQLFRR